ncbi:MAG: DUF4147 domain-containing protein, partial [Sulfurovum sp.]|nr:DUF4147 domain-containing protein [Sulfurovum sp.]
MSNKTLLNTAFNQLLEEIKPQELISNSCQLDGEKFSVRGKSYDLANFKNIYLLGSGKAVVPMAIEIQKLLKHFLKKTLLIGAYSSEEKFENGRYIQSTHPLPSDKSIESAIALQDIMQTLNEDDLFIYLLSGGNSALVELPEGKISLKEFQEATSLMLRSGMPIEKMNCVRKHLSKVKGGKLAKNTKAQGIVLVLSDVIGDDLHAIGSAPLYCDKTSFKDAIDTLKEYALFEKMPENIQTFLNKGEEGLYDETPKTPQEHIDHYILGSNSIVLEKAQLILQKEGIETTIIHKPLEGNTTELAEVLMKFGVSYQGVTHAYLFGGESTVVVKGKGKGGRNQHLCLNFLNLIDGSSDITFLSAATDGIDGNSDAAGALIDIHSLA